MYKKKMSEEIVLSGPEIDFEVPEESFGKVLIQSLKSQPRDSITQVNGETGEEQTVEELLTLGLQVGEGLRTLGLKPADVVALVANYSSQAYGTVLGALAIAAPIFPINPSFKTWELKNLFFASEPKVVFCEKQCTQYVIEALDLLQNKADIIVLNDENSNPRAKKFSDVLRNVDVDSFQFPEVENPKDDVALVVCSSGTTGFPKAVAITHRTLCFALESFKALPEDSRKVSFLQTTHLFWVSGMSLFFLCCFLGIKRVYLSNVNGTNLLHAIHNYKPGWVFMAPVYLSWILNHPDFDKYDVTSLKNISVGGSSLPQSIENLVKKKWPVPIMLSQGYGMTELYLNITVPSDKHITSVGVIGSKGIKVKVVDVNTGKTLGPNQIGELRCKHEYVLMKEYLKDKEATKLAFDESGFYKSGDLVYYNEDRHLFIVNRIKDLIKRNNHQVSPSELEDVILSLPEVEDVGVLGVPYESNQYHIWALAVKKKNAEITEQAVINYVAEKMSEEKHLDGVKFVESIPRTPSGKIMRPKLKELL